MKRNIFQEKELNILRDAVDRAEKFAGKRMVESEKIGDIIEILEDFLKKKQLICYGGTAINNILPKPAQFYNRSIEIPDYDFFSPNALDDAQVLADLYYKRGYEEVEAKAGIHGGTYKVFVNYIPVADITSVDKIIFNALKDEAIKVNGILYTPPNYLRMLIYLELSRPAGDVSRWEKILKRLILLNRFYPLKGKKCDTQDFQRTFEGKVEDQQNIYSVVKNTFIDQGLVFFGGYANSLYRKYMPKHQKKILDTIPDFDVLAEDPEEAANKVKERLNKANYKNVKIYKKKGIGEIIAAHYEIVVDKDTVAFIYKPLACHSYNTIKINNREVKIATIDTMLSFYLAFLYADRPYYDHNRIICMAEYLFTVQARNRLEQKGLLRRFSVKCYGKQKTLGAIRALKTEKYKELKYDKNSKEYKYYFLRYIPADLKEIQKDKKNRKNQKKIRKKLEKTRKKPEKTRKNQKKSEKTKKPEKIRKNQEKTRKKDLRAGLINVSQLPGDLIHEIGSHVTSLPNIPSIQSILNSNTKKSNSYVLKILIDICNYQPTNKQMRERKLKKIAELYKLSYSVALDKTTFTEEELNNKFGNFEGENYANLTEQQVDDLFLSVVKDDPIRICNKLKTKFEEWVSDSDS